jgi:hypothetical protein
MHCYELNDGGPVEGLRVEPESEREFPYVPIAEGGAFCFSIQGGLAEFLRRLPRLSPIRLDRAMFSRPGELATGRAGDVALVRLNLSAGVQGRVSLTAANERREWLIHKRVHKGYGRFPPVGVEVLGPAQGEVPSWDAGVEHLELAITMEPGAAFRILRSGRRCGLPRTSFVTWTGSDLKVSPPPKSSFPPPPLEEEDGYEEERPSQFRATRPVLELTN